MLAVAELLAGVLPRWPVAAEGVLTGCHGLKVADVVRAVPPRTAIGLHVVDMEAFGDRLDEVLIGPAVSADIDVLDREDRVAVTVVMAFPRPALIIATPVNLGQEAGFVVALDDFPVERIPVLPPRAIAPVAHALTQIDDLVTAVDLASTLGHAGPA